MDRTDGTLVGVTAKPPALLLVARYREELRLHADRHEAMTEAVHRAGPAVLASGGTVVLGMLCLVFADMNSTAGLGPVAAIGVAVTLLVLMTLLPALLVICGRWVFWPVRPAFGSAEPSATGMIAASQAIFRTVSGASSSPVKVVPAPVRSSRSW